VTTLAEQRIEFMATELAALGCKVVDTTDEEGVRRLTISGSHWLDTDSVIVSYRPASAKSYRGARGSLFCLIFSTSKYPRKGYNQATYRDALRHAEGMKDYSAHTHCEAGRHYCAEPRCTAATREDGKLCRIPLTLHRMYKDHEFVA
jgi:hypothetical protein